MLSQQTFWPAVLVRIRVLRDGLLLHHMIHSSIRSFRRSFHLSSCCVYGNLSPRLNCAITAPIRTHGGGGEGYDGGCVHDEPTRVLLAARRCRVALPFSSTSRVYSSFLSVNRETCVSFAGMSFRNWRRRTRCPRFAQLDRLTRWTAAAAAAVAMPDYCDSDPIRSVRGPSGVRLACGDCFPLIFHSTTDSKADELCICMESFEWSAQWRGITSNQII